MSKELEPWVVGHKVSATLGGLILATGVFNWSRRYIHCRPRRVTALIRWVCYQPFPGTEVGLGSVLLIGILTLSFLAESLSKHPYYYYGKTYDVAPLSLHFAYTAVSLLPFVFSFANRINPITVIARVSPERWMFFHKWGARVLWLFAVLHVSVVFSGMLRYGGLSLVKSWWRDHARLGYFFAGGKGRYLNGTVAFVALNVNMVLSLRPFRRRFYETFVLLHVSLILVMIIALFPHVTTSSTTTGRNNMWACVGIWCFGVLFKLVYTFLATIKAGKYHGKASVSVVGSATVLDVQLISKRRETGTEEKGGKRELSAWKPGQFCYLRFPELAPFQCHPFTLASCPTLSSFRFIISTRTGFTRKLAEKAEAQPDKPLAVFLEGPYGTLTERLERFDRVLIVAGGVGSTFGMGMYTHLGLMGVERKLIWSTRDVANLQWFERQHIDRDDIAVYVTGPRSLSSSQSTSASSSSPLVGILDDRQDAENNIALSPIGHGVNSENQKKGRADQTAHFGRPDLPILIDEWLQSSGKEARLAVLVCGPIEMTRSVACTAARIQWDVLRGQSGIDELWLHKEAFGW